LARLRLLNTCLLACAVAGSMTSAGGSAAATQDAFEAGVAAIPSEVREVRVAGRWRAGTDDGFYRVIVLRVGEDHVVDRLYVQWVRDAADGDRSRIAATLAVSEINDAGPFTFTYALKPEATTRLRITVNTHHTYTGGRRQFVLFATTPGTVTAKPEQPPMRPRPK
jgi:hypothetical protein